MTFFERLEKYNIKCTEYFDTSKLSSIRAGGFARYAVFPSTDTQTVETLKICNDISLRYKVIGGCTNTLFADGIFDGAVIVTSSVSEAVVCGAEITAYAGAKLSLAIKRALEHKIELSASLFGIPGTVGGAVRNNAGAYGASIADIFISGDFYSPKEEKIITLTKDELEFSYRSSILEHSDLIMIKAVLGGKFSTVEDIHNSMRSVIRKRRLSHPSEPSLGSFFKHSSGAYPARLIDDAGLKGFKVGDASISEKHAGFIINLGSASATDIDCLAKTVEETIFQKYNVKLVREAELVI